VLAIGLTRAEEALQADPQDAAADFLITAAPRGDSSNPVATILLPTWADKRSREPPSAEKKRGFSTWPDLTCFEAIPATFLRILWAKHPWGFKSPLSHSLLTAPQNGVARLGVTPSVTVGERD
jgi:hypothetical protein